MFKVTASKIYSTMDRITSTVFTKNQRKNHGPGLTRPPEILTDKKIVKNIVF